MTLVLYGILLGIGGTFLGSIITLLIGKRSDTVICYMLSFAGGIMAGISFFGLIPESVEMSNVYIAIGGIAGGIVIVLALNVLVDKITKSKSKLHETPEELHHQVPFLADSGSTDTRPSTKRLFRAGIIMLVAITLHNFPEGLAIGAALGHEVSLGITIAIVMAVHNIPEGMAVATPLLSGGMKKWKIILWTTLSGLPTIVGGIIGYYVGGVSYILQALCLSIAGGAMLYIVFGEIIPQSIAMTKSRMPTIITLLGIAIGLLIVQF